MERELGGSVVPAMSDCELRAAVMLYGDDMEAEGLELLPRTESGAMRKGIALHKAAEVGFLAKMEGKKLLTSDLAAVAIDKLMDGIEKVDLGDEFVGTKKDATEDEKQQKQIEAAKTQIIKMVPRVVEIIDGIDPMFVEAEIRVQPKWLPGWELKPHPDVFSKQFIVHDIKSGINYEPSSYQAQVALYAESFRLTGRDPQGIQIDYMKRPGPKTKVAAPIISVSYNLVASINYAKDIVTNFVEKVERFFDIAPNNPDYFNPRVFRANTQSMLCNPKYCRAYGTSTCAVTQINKVERQEQKAV